MDYPPIARNTDPSTSHEAAQALTSRETLICRIEDFVHTYPGLVRGEIAEGLGEYDQWSVGRRVSDAMRQGRIIYGGPRVYHGTGRKQQTCWPPTHREWLEAAGFKVKPILPIIGGGLI